MVTHGPSFHDLSHLDLSVKSDHEKTVIHDCKMNAGYPPSQLLQTPVTPSVYGLLLTSTFHTAYICMSCELILPSCVVEREQHTI